MGDPSQKIIKTKLRFAGRRAPLRKLAGRQSSSQPDRRVWDLRGAPQAAPGHPLAGLVRRRPR